MYPLQECRAVLAIARNHRRCMTLLASKSVKRRIAPLGFSEYGRKNSVAVEDLRRGKTLTRSEGGAAV
jgi:hypothetical protein